MNKAHTQPFSPQHTDATPAYLYAVVACSVSSVTRPILHLINWRSPVEVLRLLQHSHISLSIRDVLRNVTHRQDAAFLRCIAAGVEPHLRIQHTTQPWMVIGMLP